MVEIGGVKAEGCADEYVGGMKKCKGGGLALGVFGGGEEDEEGEVFGDFVKEMFLVGGDEEDGTGHYVLGFVFELEFCMAGDDVVDFVFGVRLLGVGCSGS